MLPRTILLLILAFLLIAKTHASALISLPFSDQLLSTVANKKQWQQLLKIDNKSLIKREIFAIHSPSFYFTEPAALTAKNELINTLHALLSAKHYEQSDQHPQCRFPARYIWLKKQFDLSQLTPVACEKYQNWAKLSSTKSISLIFATGYLGNPASYYGHTLLKLNATSQQPSDLLDTSVNFGADVPANEDPISYIVKGVVGGYEGRFSHSKHYYHSQNYLENELRDLWEYQLNLEQADFQFLVAHIWELIAQDYTYYFFDENCVYRMYELLKLIEGVTLPELTAPWVIPQEVVRAINVATYKGAPLVKSQRYIPSRQAKFYNKYWQLSVQAKILVAKIVAEPEQLSLLDSQNVTPMQRRKILSTLIDYYQYLLAVDDKAKAKHKQRYTRILAYRYQQPIGKAKFNSKEAVSPHNARPSSYLQLGLLQAKDHGNGYSIKLRPAYYDQLDAEVGHVKNGVLKMAELELAYLSEQLAISSFTVFEVLSVKNQASGLPQDGYDSWRLYLGMKKQADKCVNCADFTFQADKGWAVPLSDKTTVAAYVGGALIENYQHRGRLYASSRISLTQTITAQWNILLNIEARKYLENAQLTLVNYSAETRYKFNVNNHFMDLRLALSQYQAQVSLGYYW
ncbi:protein of unknown function [Colwellia chukchiensis]|uniref:Uncharacterized protein n=1 Tax=Colwellia chukchiensis TaxID=641665 RepID=A0A1H7PEU3_9GAMM|nr:DUF4105 domain-containing protein [Colwellia chukchiensis]SEL34169.1 protein of unknown function [Colwellia chukchiensis]